jgi:hypothetical protein
MILRLVAAAVGLAMLAGCEESTRYRSISLGNVEMPAAMMAARDVMGQYYGIAEVDEYAHKFTCDPKVMRGATAGLLSKGSARELAVLRLRSEGNAVWADVSIIVQHGEAPQRRMMDPWISGYDYPSPPPYQKDAPYTAEQEEAWQTVGHNDATEARILQDLYNALHPETTSRPGK